jgi:urea transporter
MAAVLPCHIALLLANLTVIAMQPRRLSARHFTFPYFLVNAVVLVREAIVNLSAAWVHCVPVGLRDAAPANENASAATAAILKGTLCMFVSDSVEGRLLAVHLLSVSDDCDVDRGFVSSETEYFV